MQPTMAGGEYCSGYDGMTLRQYAAVHILQGILAANDHAHPVTAAVAYADELIKALAEVIEGEFVSK